MDLPVCKLTIVCPPEVEERIFDLLLAPEIADGGFTTLAAEGHGHSFDNASAGERVRGRVKRTMIVLVLPVLRVDTVLDRLRKDVPVAHIACWTEPVEGFRRLVENVDLGPVQ